MRVSLRSTPLVPSLLQGSAYKGRPWPFTPLAASMRLTPFHNDSTRPPDGALGVACENGDSEQVGRVQPAMVLFWRVSPALRDGLAMGIAALNPSYESVGAAHGRDAFAVALRSTFHKSPKQRGP